MDLQTINLTEKDTRKNLTVSTGQVFIFTLPNRFDGGYRFDREQYDQLILGVQKHTETPPPANSALGKPGEDTWQFIALKKGKTTLKITASRPWKKEGATTVFEDIIEVK